MPQIRLENTPMMECLSIKKYENKDIPSNLDLIKIVVKPAHGIHTGTEQTLIISPYLVMEYVE